MNGGRNVLADMVGWYYFNGNTARGIRGVLFFR